MDKITLRQHFRQRRRSLTPSQWQEASQALCHHLAQWPPFQRAQTVGAYVSAHQEPDLSSLLTLPKTWGFPRCVGNQLTWSAWRWGDPLIPGDYGIPTPALTAPTLEAPQIDLLLIPALGMDRRGYRLGYGGGYYDRLLDQLQWQKVPTVGIVYHWAVVDCLPADPWDRPLGGWCSETGYQGAYSS